MKKTWPTIRKTTKNSKPAFLVDARIDGTGERRFFQTKAEAEGFAHQCRIRRRNEGQSALVDDELASYGWTIKKAVDFALDHLRQASKGTPLPDAIAALVNTKRAAGKSDRYQRDIAARLGRLASAFSGRAIGTISTADLDTFLSSLEVAPGTRNTFRRDIRTLWHFAEKRGWATATAARATERSTAPSKPPGILTVSQAAALLANSVVNPALIAFHAFGLFAGLRVAEIRRLNWSDVDIAGGFIHVSAANSKTRSRRLVPILPNLASWLAPIAKAEGKVVAYEIRTAHENARDAAGITEWPDNALRHSFVSYRLAATGNAAQTALEAGHDQSVLFAHYRELVRPKDAETYFAIMPENDANVVAFAAS